jgi:hypothetical protein
MENPEFNRKRLELLEKLIFRLKKRVIVVSSVDPCFYFTHDDEEAPPLPAAQISDETNRWAKVLYGFETHWIESHPKLDQNYYRVLWSTCTRLERAALFQLATEGWANYKNRHALQHLYERRLVTWHPDDPIVRIASPEFHNFVAKSISVQDREAWIESDREGRWLALRHLVVVVLIALAAAAFYVAQQQTLALLASASTLVPSAWKFISDLRGGRSGEAKDGAAA